jgi:hypothetical protein
MTTSDLLLAPSTRASSVLGDADRMNRASDETPDVFAEDARRVLDGALAVLAQGEDLLESISVESYTRKLPAAFNGAIGGHYRHCLDHFTSLLRGAGTELVDYDHRERDPRIERDPAFALDLTRQIRARLGGLSPDDLLAPVVARCEVNYAHGESPLTRSTLGRELVYAIAHAIHHYALIAVMARLMEVELPVHFGIAPSTVAHLKQLEARAA